MKRILLFMVAGIMSATIARGAGIADPKKAAGQLYLMYKGTMYNVQGMKVASEK